MNAVLLPLPAGEGWNEGQPRVEEPSARYLVELQPPLVRSFDLLATAPRGVARLRELILSLAVQGKLTTPAHRGDSARQLLAEIESRKAKSEATGVIKRGKPLSPVREEDVPFQIPGNWAWVRLGQITNFGSTIKGDSIADSTWVLDLEDIEKDTARLLDRVTFADRRSLSDKNVFQAGDVLYGKLRPYLNKVIVADRDGVCTTEILPFHCFGPYEPEYFRIAIQSPYFLAYVNSKSYGMKMPRLGTEDGRQALVPLPPFAEQARIVARVEELMKLCDALQERGRLEAEQHARLLSTLFDTLAASENAQALAENWQRIAQHFDLLLDRPEAVDALEQTILQLAVRGLLVLQDPSDEPASRLLDCIRTDGNKQASGRKIKQLPPIDDDDTPFPLPSGWAWARFPELGEFGRGKSKHRPRNDPALFTPGIYPLVQTGEVARAKGVIADYHSKYSDIGLAQSKLWPKGTLCITIAANIADVAILGFDACFPDSVVGFVPHTEIGDVSYLLTFMETAREHLIEFAPSTAQKNINLEILESMLIPLPPAAELRRIVARVQQLRALCAQLRERLQQARHTQGLLVEALVKDATA